MAREATLRAVQDAASRGPRALPSDAIVAIVLAANSAEAFINEFAEYIPLIYNLVIEPPPAISTCSAVLKELEESRVPVTVKYLVASQSVSGVPFDKGSAPFQDFKQLVDLRNAIMHIKVATEGERHAGTRIADILAQRGIAIMDRGEDSLSWFDRLMTPAVAKWAHDSALSIIRDFLQRVPVPDGIDPLDIYRERFRDHPLISDPT